MVVALIQLDHIYEMNHVCQAAHSVQKIQL